MRAKHPPGIFCGKLLWNFWLRPLATWTLQPITYLRHDSGREHSQEA